MARVTAEAKARKAAYDREYRAKHGVRIRARIDAYAATHTAEKSAYDRSRREQLAPRIAEAKAAYHAEHREAINGAARERYIKRTYGLRLQDKIELLVDQGGVCAICRVELDGTQRNVHLDHDHETGRIRGVLCQPCNMGLGAFRDDAERMLAAVEYLRTHQRT